MNDRNKARQDNGHEEHLGITVRVKVGGEDRKKSMVGVELVRALAAEGDRVFTTQRARELCSRVDLNESYLLEALHHLRRNGWIVSLRRGLYAMSPRVPGVSPAHEFEIAMYLVDPAAISHWSAMQHHGLTEQVPGRVFVLTTREASVPRARGSKADQTEGGYPVADTIYRFVQVKPERFFGTEEVWVGEARITITDPERTLIDGLTMPQYCGDFAEVLNAFQVRGEAIDLDRIIEYALRLDKATAKRLGWVLEHLGIAEKGLKRLDAVPVTRYQPLDPTGPRKGPCNGRWMIQENLPGRIAQ
jgi:predicted transcriptional regulator of viral defense system